MRQFFLLITTYLKSEDGLGDVNTVVVEAVLVLGTDEVIVVVLELESGMVDTVVLLGGGVQGGVEGGVPPILDDETMVSSMSTGLCSWSRIIFLTKLYFGFFLFKLGSEIKQKKET